MPAVKGKEWDSVIIVEKGSGSKQNKVRCLYCKAQFLASATRIRSHIINSKGAGIGRCKASPPQALIDELKKIEKSKVQSQRGLEIRRKLERNFRDGKLKQKCLTDSSSGACKEEADSALSRFFFAEGIPFVKASSPYFREMLLSVSKSPGYRPPDRHTIASTLLDKEYKSLKEAVSNAFPAGKSSTLVSDGWKATNHEPLVNFVVCSGQDR